eukprot:361082-Chlamydomonas_euryale.AAC.21
MLKERERKRWRATLVWTCYTCALFKLQICQMVLFKQRCHRVCHDRSRALSVAATQGHDNGRLRVVEGKTACTHANAASANTLQDIVQHTSFFEISPRDA